MASTSQEYLELMNAEDFVELQKLRDIARHGVPDDIRGEVWKYLLGVHDPDKSKEMSVVKAREEEYRAFQTDLLDPTITARLKGEIKRYQQGDSEVIKIFEHVISAHLNNHRGAAYTPALVHICVPLVYSLKKESEVYYCFESVMNQIESFLSKQDANELLARFNTLFRTTLPDLYNYFEEEEINANEWATPWLSYFLARELPLQCVLRLWDTYFSTPERFDLHIYVCLAILKKFKDELEDLEHSEILGFLRRLPVVDMDQIITEAYSLRQDISVHL